MECIVEGHLRIRLNGWATERRSAPKTYPEQYSGSYFQPLGGGFPSKLKWRCCSSFRDFSAKDKVVTISLCVKEWSRKVK